MDYSSIIGKIFTYNSIQILVMYLHTDLTIFIKGLEEIINKIHGTWTFKPVCYFVKRTVNLK